MQHIFLNLKRFDIPPEFGGVNRLCAPTEWGGHIVGATEQALSAYSAEDVEFVMFFPEAHLIPALRARGEHSPIRLGCQGIHRQDTAAGGNFGAFTTNRTGHAMQAIGCEAVLIGHCEERRDKTELLGEGASRRLNQLLNQEIRAAQAAGLNVLYCIGESSEEQERWQEVLRAQLAEGLEGTDRAGITLAYEPLWAIGPGKTPPDRDYIQKIAAFVKAETGGLELVYGGGLKSDNAEMLASIPEIDGGLIALTRFGGDIGFYPDEYLEIVKLYLSKKINQNLS